MRVVIQRVSHADVKIAGVVVAEIGVGLLVLLGIAEGDQEEDGIWLVQKIAKLRIFPDEQARMNRDVTETNGAVLVVSQFTLLASTRKGTRPSFNAAAKPEGARLRYEHFLQQLTTTLSRPVAAGEFGAEMKVGLINDGPVTLVIDSRQRE